MNDAIDHGATYSNDGSILTQTLPGQSGWTRPTPETLSYGYSTGTAEAGLLNTVVGTSTYVFDHVYDALGRLDYSDLGGAPYRARINPSYWAADGRLGAIYSNVRQNGTNLSTATTTNIYYDTAGLISAVRQNT